MYEILTDPIEATAAIMRKHLTEELKQKGTVKIGLESANMEGDNLTFSLPDWIIQSKEDVTERYGKEDGLRYFSKAIEIIWREVGAMRTTH